AFGRWCFLFDAFDLTAFKHARELFLEHIARLSGEHFKYILPEHRASRNTELAEFPISVPRNRAILPIDCIKRQRQTIDNRFDESLLRFTLRRSSFNFSGKTYRRVSRGLVERTDVCR